MFCLLYAYNYISIYQTAEGYCRGKKCADNAVCDDGSCVCRGGYSGDGYETCKRNDT